MKKFGVIVLVSLFAIFAVLDFVRDFNSNDTIRYYAEGPHRLLVVAVIGITGGMVCFLFNRLSPQLRRTVKLLTLGSAASFLTLAGGFFAYHLVGLGSTLTLNLLSIFSVAALAWFEFYQVFRRRGV